MADNPVQVNGRPESTSASWLERVRNRDVQAWESFVRLYSPLIFYWCQKCGLPAADAADIGQEVFQAVLAGIGKFTRKGSGSFRGWLRVITRNKVQDFFRKRTKIFGGDGDAGYDLNSIPDHLNSNDTFEQDEERILYQRAIELVLLGYRETTQQAFLRVVLEREDPSAVALDLGLTVSAIYQVKSRLLRRLREEFAGLIEADFE